MTTLRTDLYATVTDSIITALEAGTRPWHKPWSTANTDRLDILPVRANGIPYRGINILLLWGARARHGFASNRWMTYRQGTELGGQVRPLSVPFILRRLLRPIVAPRWPHLTRSLPQRPQVDVS